MSRIHPEYFHAEPWDRFIAAGVLLRDEPDEEDEEDEEEDNGEEDDEDGEQDDEGYSE